MDIDETIDAFRRGALDFDCKKIVLSQHAEGGQRFEGQGYIRQELDDALTFKLYVTHSENAKPFGRVDAKLDTMPGKIYSEDYGDALLIPKSTISRCVSHWRPNKRLKRLRKRRCELRFGDLVVPATPIGHRTHD